MIIAKIVYGNNSAVIPPEILLEFYSCWVLFLNPTCDRCDRAKQN
ncbi:hypothetical protein [Planktothricoides raciborskii]|uniref:Uncharacterized protein n=1 Tax=Planktothricoides raciborskii GIHE-MW2 TaxID=2792601 RepID=A0AAU8JHE4_9CYAN